MAKRRWVTAEVKAGLFLTFCLGLFVAMLFLYAKATRHWRGRQDLHVAFTQVSNLRPDARVLYNGLEVGRVRKMTILTLNENALGLLAPFTEHALENLPLTDEERGELRGEPAATLNEKIRQKVAGRNMVHVVMEVLEEGDEKRYREDDRVQIVASLMGSAAVDIVSGVGPPVKAGQAYLWLGTSGDMYGSLAKSLNQMKNILSSVGEMIGGGDAGPAAQRVASFDQFTERLDTLPGTVQKKLPETWDTIEARLGQAQEKTASLARQVKEKQPEWSKELTKANEELEKLRQDLGGPIDEARQKVAQQKDEACKSLKSIADQVRKQKEALPTQIREAREWTENVAGRVTAIDREMTYYDERLTRGLESTRQALNGLRTVADNAEEKLWYLAHYPWIFAKGAVREVAAQLGLSDREVQMAADAAWRKSLVSRHYGELRQELERARKELNPRDASDQARVSRIVQILREMDAYLAARPERK